MPKPAEPFRRSWCLLAALLVVVAAAAPSCDRSTAPGKPAAVGITHGPLLISLSPTQASLVWESAADGSGAVLYAPQDDPSAPKLRTPSAVFRVSYEGDRFVSRKPISSGVAYIHKAEIEKLKPGTVYRYTVSAAGGKAVSGDLVFRTPEAEAREFTFIGYGDSRSGTEVHRSLLRQMQEYPISFLLHTGDLVTIGMSYPAWQEEYFEPLAGLGDRVPIFAVLGNHDTGPYYDLLCRPVGGNDNFSFDWGNAHFTCLDNNEVLGDSLDWAVKDLEKSKARWKFVCYHEPTLNVGGHASSWEYPEAVKAFDRVGVDIVLAGHSHLYERFRPVRADAQSTQATTYITTGGGGAPLYTAGRSELLAAGAAEYHFCVFTIKGDTLSMKALTAEGKLLDEMSMTKGPAGLDAAFLKSAVTMSDVESGLSAAILGFD
jgi:predicted phosphodiesterase